VREKDIHWKYYSYDEKEDWLGECGFANVYKAILKGTNEKRALKLFDINKLRQELEKINFSIPTDEDIQPYIDGFYNEIKYMKIAEGKNKDNINTVHFYEYFHTSDEFVIVMELCDMNLTKLLSKKEKNKAFNISEIYNILTQLNNTFRILNENKIIHRDIKLESILIKYDNKDNDDSLVKLSDYGISKQLFNFTRLITANKGGTYNLIAPEILEKGEFNTKSDLWSLGVVIYVLYFKEYPYKGFNEGAIINKINNEGQKFLKESGNLDFDNLIRGLLSKDSNKRLKWKDYFEHDFFINNSNNNDINKLSNKNEKLQKRINFFPFEILDFKINRIKGYINGSEFNAIAHVSYIQRLGYLSFLEIYYGEKPLSYEYFFNMSFQFKDISFLITFIAGSTHLPGGDPNIDFVTPLTIITFPVDNFDYLSSCIRQVKEKRNHVKITLIWNAYKIDKRIINKKEEEEFSEKEGVDYSFEVSSKEGVEYCLNLIANILYNTVYNTYKEVPYGIFRTSTTTAILKNKKCNIF